MGYRWRRMAPSRGSVARSPRTTTSPGDREHADAPRPARTHPAGPAPLRGIAKGCRRMGVTGFGGPAAHIAMLRRLVIDRYEWMDARSFEDANAACGMLPGPASTQLAIFCAYRVAGP